ncbi:site-specific integrase [Shewanella sp. BF02_Schw]|uniref:site-specific integrase n=1 Tax=Shewanella sp. BF02_Schw TaxID=394908 RepID=UPI001780540A|nr:site-specific integrase [Shewanella sp. BF02_Schw]MBO1895800.1 site-specific integrase [Shewanella sp. BF02_Schw]
MFNYSTLQRYHDDLGLVIEKRSDIDWVCLQIEQHASQRQLSEVSLKQINNAISDIPTGRQRRLKRAKAQVLQFLYEVCDWVLPLKEEARCQDRALEWMREIQIFNDDAGRVLRGYSQQRQRFLAAPKSRSQSELAWLLVVLYIEVAPLPLNYWQAVLCSTDPITFFEGQYTLKVPHPTPIAAFANDTQPSFTRLPLPLFAYRLLQQYMLQQTQEPTKSALLKALNSALSAQPYYLVPRSEAKWQRTFQSLWHHHYQVPAELLRDISDPLRHVATLPQHFSPTLPLAIKKSLYQPIVFQRQENQDAIHSKSGKLHWPHKELIKSYRRKNNASAVIPLVPSGTQDNILPKLLFHFCESLFIEGGVKRDNLPADTVDRYSNFYKNLAPLTYQAACEPDKLALWAQQAFETLNDKDSQAWHFYQFLRSVSQQPLTDHLDLSQFEKPSLPARVDPFRLSVAQLHLVIEHLLSSSNGHALQRLFASVAALFGFYGALRRGEVLRLRVGDIRQAFNQNNHFQLTITKTAEGRTKNRQTRHVYIVMPEVAAKLVRIVIKIHAESDHAQPLLALCGESIASRASHYLYPVTQVLKGLFGTQVRFHHLRHSGVELTYLQGLHLAYEREDNHLACLLDDRAMQTMLTKQNCLARFSFWLEGRDFSEINDCLLFDVISAQFGHAHYATTRRHYLHGLERIIPLFKPHKCYYSRDELRFILDMPTGSNDISRVLAELSPQYASLPEQAKKCYRPYYSEAQLLKRIVPKQPASMLKQQWDDNEWLKIWTANAPRQWHNGQVFHLINGQAMRKLTTGELTMRSLSQAWMLLGQHQGLVLDKKQCTAMKHLGGATIAEAFISEHLARPDEPGKLDIVFNCPCNQRTLKAFQSLCHQGFLKSFNAKLTLVQNRKSLNSHKLELVKSHFARKQDTVLYNVIPVGDTSLNIILHTPFSAIIFKRPLAQYFADLLTITT